MTRAALGTSDDLVPWYTRFGFTKVARERTATIKTMGSKHGQFD
jgi:hypothetical protein